MNNGQINIIIIFLLFVSLILKKRNEFEKMRLASLVSLFFLYLIESKNYVRYSGITGISIIFFVILVLPILFRLKEILKNGN